MPRSRIYYGWYIVAACFCFSFLFAGAGFYSFSIFINPIEREFGWHRSAIALAMSIYLIVNGLMGPFIGRLIQQYGPRRVMRIGGICAGICFMLVSLTNALWYFYATYALLAVSVCTMGIIPSSTLLTNWFDKRRGTAIGFSMVGISTGGLVLTPSVSWITGHFGWQAAFLIIGLVVWLVSLPLVHFVIRDTPAELGLTADDMPKPQPPSGDTSPLPFDSAMDMPSSAILRSRPFWCIFASFFLAPFAQMGVLQHQVPLIMDNGIPETVAAAALGVTAGVGGIGKLSFGRFSEIWPFRYVALLCFGLQGAAVALLLIANSTAMVWLYAITFGFAMGGVVVLMPLVVGHYWGLLSYGLLLGVIWVANAAGGALGTFVSGLIYDHLGNYRYAIYLFILAYAAAIITFLAAGTPNRGRS